MLNCRAIYGPTVAHFFVWMRVKSAQRFSSLGWADHRECHVKGDLLLIYQRSPTSTSPLCDWERMPSCTSKREPGRRNQVGNRRFWGVKDGAVHSQRCVIDGSRPTYPQTRGAIPSKTPGNRFHPGKGSFGFRLLPTVANLPVGLAQTISTRIYGCVSAAQP